MFRAILAIMRLDIWQAIRYNALSILLLPPLFLLIIRDSVRYVRMKPKKPTSRPELVISICITAISVLYTVSRNLPFFEALRPTEL